MNDFFNLNAFCADEMVRHRQETSARAHFAATGPRRTTRRQVVSGLRRLADRLDG